MRLGSRLADASGGKELGGARRVPRYAVKSFFINEPEDVLRVIAAIAGCSVERRQASRFISGSELR